MVQGVSLKSKTLVFFVLLAASIAASFSLKLSPTQIISLSAFLVTILGTILFWEFRLSFAFLASTIVLFTRTATLSEFLRFSSMEIIFFLIGMMVIVGFLREIGLFSFLLQRALIIPNLTAKKFIATIVFTSALLACVVDEVSSILFMIMIIMELSDYFEVDPIPFIMASVLATNIGSAGTVIGNPIGLLIAAKAHLTFEDFMIYAFPLMFLSLFVLLGVLFVIFRREIKALDKKMKSLGANEFLVSLLNVPAERKLRIGFIIFGSTLALIGMHHRLEVLLGLETNTVLLIAPLMASAIIMVWRHAQARNYIEHDVEWWTLLFFLFLFAQVGVLTETGVAAVLSEKLLMLVAQSKVGLIATILFGGALISSALDNVVVVAGFIPILDNLTRVLELKSILWWALLFGACFGGNITVIGSTANIMALGTLERKHNITISFQYWFKIGIVVGLTTLAFIMLALMLLPHYW